MSSAWPARFHDGMQAIALPLPDAARHISLFAGADWSGPVPRDIAATMRQLIQDHMIAPATQMLPWLGDSFYMMEETAVD